MDKNGRAVAAGGGAGRRGRAGGGGRAGWAGAGWAWRGLEYTPSLAVQRLRFTGFPGRGLGVQTLVREPKSRMLHGADKLAVRGGASAKALR